MKNSKGISLIALIITIIVIIILAAIVIGGVFNTPNDAKFANFCQEYDRVQTAVQLKYYQLYQRYAIDASLTEIPTHYEIYNEVAYGSSAYKASEKTGANNNDYDGWVVFSNWTRLADGTAHNADGVCEQPTGLTYTWYLRLNDGKIAYGGFEKEEKTMYYTPNVYATGASRPQLELSTSPAFPNQTLAPKGASTVPSTGLALTGSIKPTT